jgi:hypothetical protein
MPAGLPVGNYRVVDDTGRVARLEIATTDCAPDDANRCGPPADFHMTSVGTRRWYFIRLQAGDGTDNTVGESASEIQHSPRPFLNRKFDFTGYMISNRQDEPVVDGSVIEQVVRPDPPELPVSG